MVCTKDEFCWFFLGLEISTFKKQLGSFVHSYSLDLRLVSVSRWRLVLLDHRNPLFLFELGIPSSQLSFVRLVPKRFGQTGLQVKVLFVGHIAQYLAGVGRIRSRCRRRGGECEWL